MNSNLYFVFNYVSQEFTTLKTQSASENVDGKLIILAYSFSVKAGMRATHGVGAARVEHEGVWGARARARAGRLPLSGTRHVRALHHRQVYTRE